MHLWIFDVNEITKKISTKNQITDMGKIWVVE